jgi:hypothetical protein
MPLPQEIDVKRILAEGSRLFSTRGSLENLWQEVAENFYVERADFTRERDSGEDFAAHLTSSYPLMVRRELGNQLGGILRPSGQEWFFGTTDQPERLDRQGRAWLEYATKVQRSVMYDRMSQFVRATKQCDHDWAAFGQGVISYETDWKTVSLLYRNWHLRDVTWKERYNGQIGEVHRNWKPTASELKCQFGDKAVHDSVKRMCEMSNGHAPIHVRHVVAYAEDYGIQSRMPYVCVYIDVANEHVMKVEERPSLGYVIPRWVMIAGSQYAYSAATVVALPDARLLQSMSLTLLEAGEMAVRPPMVAAKEVIRGDVALYPGGITWVDAEYDERLGQVLRPITQDKTGIPWGLEMSRDKQAMLAEAFYLNKLSMPSGAAREMTAYEVSQMVQQYIREALPLFEPAEQEYNAPLCEATFETLFQLGAFGPYKDIPKSVRGQNIKFRYESPLFRAVERVKGQKLMEAQGMIANAAQMDPSCTAMLDVRTALRDALDGIGIPAKWTRDEEAVEQQAVQVKQQQQMQQQLAMAQQGADVAETAGRAEKQMAEVQ